MAPSLLRTLCTLSLCLPLALSHMQMEDPSPLRDPHSNRANEPKDYNILTPLHADGSDFSCKGYQWNTPLTPVASYEAGQTYELKLRGGATHGGGSCQIALSCDNGRHFKVLKSIIGGCPISKSYEFTIPEYAESGQCLLGWTWFNRVGNREMYMNCAVVDILGYDYYEEYDDYEDYKKRAVADAESSEASSAAAQAALSGLPDLYVANLASVNKCKTQETVDPVFDDPGDEVEYGETATSTWSRFARSARRSLLKKSNKCTGVGKKATTKAVVVSSPSSSSSTSYSSSSKNGANANGATDKDGYPYPGAGTKSVSSSSSSGSAHNVDEWDDAADTKLASADTKLAYSGDDSGTSRTPANCNDGQWHPECYGGAATQETTSSNEQEAQYDEEAQYEDEAQYYEEEEPEVPVVKSPKKSFKFTPKPSSSNRKQRVEEEEESFYDYGYYDDANTADYNVDEGLYRQSRQEPTGVPEPNFESAFLSEHAPVEKKPSNPWDNPAFDWFFGNDDDEEEIVVDEPATDKYDEVPAPEYVEEPVPEYQEDVAPEYDVPADEEYYEDEEDAPWEFYDEEPVDEYYGDAEEYYEDVDEEYSFDGEYDIFEGFDPQPDTIDNIEVISDGTTSYLVVYDTESTITAALPLETPIYGADGNLLVDVAFGTANPDQFLVPVSEPTAAIEPAVPGIVPGFVPGVVEQPVEQPTVEPPVLEQPTVESPIEQPVVQPPVVESPVWEQPVVEQPVVEQPVVEQPVFEAPVVQPPVVESPVAEEPTIEQPVADEEESWVPAGPGPRVGPAPPVAEGGMTGFTWPTATTFRTLATPAPVEEDPEMFVDPIYPGDDPDAVFSILPFFEEDFDEDFDEGAPVRRQLRTRRSSTRRARTRRPSRTQAPVRATRTRSPVRATRTRTPSRPTRTRYATRTRMTSQPIPTAPILINPNPPVEAPIVTPPMSPIVVAPDVVSTEVANTTSAALPELALPTSDPSGRECPPQYAGDDTAAYLPCRPGTFLCRSPTDYYTCIQDVSGWTYGALTPVAAGMMCQPALVAGSATVKRRSVKRQSDDKSGDGVDADPLSLFGSEKNYQKVWSGVKPVKLVDPKSIKVKPMSKAALEKAVKAEVKAKTASKKGTKKAPKKAVKKVQKRQDEEPFEEDQYVQNILNKEPFGNKQPQYYDEDEQYYDDEEQYYDDEQYYDEEPVEEEQYYDDEGYYDEEPVNEEEQYYDDEEQYYDEEPAQEEPVQEEEPVYEDEQYYDEEPLPEDEAYYEDEPIQEEEQYQEDDYYYDDYEEPEEKAWEPADDGTDGVVDQDTLLSLFGNEPKNYKQYWPVYKGHSDAGKGVKGPMPVFKPRPAAGGIRPQLPAPAPVAGNSTVVKTEASVTPEAKPESVSVAKAAATSVSAAGTTRTKSEDDVSVDDLPLLMGAGPVVPADVDAEWWDVKGGEGKRVKRQERCMAVPQGYYRADQYIAVRK